ncbi:MAG: DUF2851 family protein [Opitutales bacterium]
MSIAAVHEVQGLYGPFSISERVIQKIWLRGDFYQEDLRTTSGKPLKVLDPGRWNMNEGPDFREARLEIDGREIIGDVEIHFHANDWLSHGHDSNPNFEQVVLHVLLYGDMNQGSIAAASPPMESLVLMPLLERDLEEYAMEAALLDLEQVNELEWFERFMEKPLSERRALLGELSAERWQQKAGFAGKRLERADWDRCCHESTLEVLGFARNRSTMHKIATRYSIADFCGACDTDLIYEQFRGDWKLSGCRPANHPKLRLKQYARICAADPDWPQALMAHLSAAEKPDSGATTADFRKSADTKAFQALLAEDVFQGVIGSKRLNSLLCDAIFPLADAAGAGRWKACWQHWYPGDFPEAFARFHRQAGLVEARMPMSNGLMQGILALFASKGAAI